MNPFDEATRRFLAVGDRTPKPLPAGVETLTLRLPTPDGWPDGTALALRVHVRGAGPAALLVHGWRSQAADLEPLSAMLAEAGFAVWMPDLPAHGHSDGTLLAMPLAAAALHAVQARSGPFAVAVGHSYGAAALVHAVAGGLAGRRLAAARRAGPFQAARRPGGAGRGARVRGGRAATVSPPAPTQSR